MADQDTVDRILGMQKKISDLQQSVGSFSSRKSAFFAECVSELMDDSLAGTSPFSVVAIGAGTESVQSSLAGHPGILRFSQNGANTGYYLGFTTVICLS